MNVVIYAHYQPPQPSASATRMLSLARHLRAEGWKVTLLTSMEGPPLAEGFSVVRVKGRAGLVRWLANNPRCPLFVSSPPATPAAEVAWAGRMLGYRVMVDIRDPSVLEALKQKEMRVGLRTWFKATLEKSLPRAGEVVSFVSEALRTEFAHFADYSPSATVIAPNGVDLEIFKWSLERRAAARMALRLRDEPVFCYQGILGGKDLPQAVTALTPALAQGAKLLIFGIVDTYSAPLKDQLHQQMAESGVQHALLWHENLTPNEMAALLPAADIGINPLPANRAYCLPVKTYEYMAAGLYNLAHGAPGGALSKQLPDLAGQITHSWTDYQSAALACLDNLSAIRDGSHVRSELARQFSRQVANRRLAKALGELAG